jgi:uncharacterized protein YjbJ (UPF0337 family)
MRAELGWLLAGGAIGATIAVMAMTDVEQGLASGNKGYNSLDRAAAKTFGWGTKQRAEGKVGSVLGSVKEGVGRFTGDTNLEAEGTVDKVTGKVKDAVGEFGTAAAQTLHDLNR